MWHLASESCPFAAPSRDHAHRTYRCPGFPLLFNHLLLQERTDDPVRVCAVAHRSIVVLVWFLLNLQDLY